MTFRAAFVAAFWRAILPYAPADLRSHEITIQVKVDAGQAYAELDAIEARVLAIERLAATVETWGVRH